MAEFSEHAICWQLYPLGALGAPKLNPEIEVPEKGPFRPVRTLADLGTWVDHARRLGANAILLGPIFQSYSHGYDTIDYFRIDSRLGTMEDFSAFIEYAHRQGMAVLADGVFNHVSPYCPQMRDVVQRGPQSPYADFFRAEFTDWHPGRLPAYDTFEGHAGLAALNHGNTQVRALIGKVMDYWSGRGLDGWRLDAAYAVDPQLWAQILPPLRRKYPHLWVFGEVIHGDYPQLVAQAGWDSLTQYELWKSIWSSLSDHNFYELQWNLTRHLEFCEHFWPQTFLSNHDVTRIASRLTPGQVGQAAAILLTLPGVPSIYYGDELGYQGVKEERAGGDDAIRPRLPATAGVTTDRQKKFWHYYASLIALRRRHPWLAHAKIEVTHIENEVISYRASAADGSGELLVVCNNSEETIGAGHPALAEIGHPALADSFQNGEISSGTFGVFAPKHERMGA